MSFMQGKTQVSIWQSADLGGELLSGCFHDFTYPVHTHETACFALLTAGAIRIRMRGSEFIARKGDLYAIEAEEPHAGWPVDNHGWQLRTLYVDTRHLRRLLAISGCAHAVDLLGPVIRDQALTGLFQQAHWLSQHAGERLVLDEHYLRFAARLFERHVRGSGPNVSLTHEPRAIRVTREYLDAHLACNVHLEDIAQAAGLPVYRLFRTFEQYTGMTPHGYLRQARVRQAISLIKAGDKLSDIAASVGFSDQAHLTRHFRRIMGVTPGVYQKAMLN